VHEDSTKLSIRKERAQDASGTRRRQFRFGRVSEKQESLDAKKEQTILTKQRDGREGKVNHIHNEGSIGLMVSDKISIRGDKSSSEKTLKMVNIDIYLHLGKEKNVEGARSTKIQGGKNGRVVSKIKIETCSLGLEDQRRKMQGPICDVNILGKLEGKGLIKKSKKSYGRCAGGTCPLDNSTGCVRLRHLRHIRWVGLSDRRRDHLPTAGEETNTGT